MAKRGKSLIPTIEQIAVAVADIDEAIAAHAMCGHDQWVRDTVSAKGKLVKHYRSGRSKVEKVDFTVKLAFNYTLIPDKEFELIQLLENSQKSVQFVGSAAPFLSHMGLHGKVHPYLRHTNLVMAVETYRHANTNRRYRYVFLDMRETCGYFLKVIERLNPEEEAPEPEKVNG